MPTVLDHAALAASPLADLHALASELGIDGYRRLRKPQLIEAIIAHQTGAAPADANGAATPSRAEEGEEDEVAARPTRRRTRARSGAGRTAADAEPEPAAAPEPAVKPAPSAATSARPATPPARTPAPTVEGAIELMPNGSGMLRVSDGEDIYVSAAQVRRCELVAGDVISGPVRSPRRSERHPSLIRVDTINGSPADQVVEGTPYDELPATPPRQPFALAPDPTLEAVMALAPFGRGSRVVIAGPARSGKSTILRRIAAALAADEQVELALCLVGVRPEELGTEDEQLPEPEVRLSFAAAADALAQALGRALERAKRVASRGGHIAVLVDTLDDVAPSAARRALAGARNLAAGGSLTVIATASRPLGGETTVIALDARRAALGQWPALDPLGSGTLRPELLVGDKAAATLAQARAAAVGEI